MRVISGDELTTALGNVPGWGVEGRCLTQTRTFADFAEAMRFVNDAAGLAERMDHHPDMDIRYNRVKLTLTTHDAGGITDRDVRLASLLNTL